MKTSELLKVLKAYGIYLLENGGRHDIYYSPLTGKKFAVGRHTKEIPVGTVNRILKDAGIK